MVIGGTDDVACVASGAGVATVKWPLIGDGVGSIDDPGDGVLSALPSIRAAA